MKWRMLYDDAGISQLIVRGYEKSCQPQELTELYSAIS